MYWYCETTIFLFKDITPTESPTIAGYDLWLRITKMKYIRSQEREGQREGQREILRDVGGIQSITGWSILIQVHRILWVIGVGSLLCDSLCRQVPHTNNSASRLRRIWTRWWIYHTSSQASVMDPSVRVWLRGVSWGAPRVSWPLWKAGCSCVSAFADACVCGSVAAGIHRYTGHRSHGVAIIHRQGWRWIMLPPLPPPGPRPLAGQAFGWPAVIKATAGRLSAWQITTPALVYTQKQANIPTHARHTHTHAHA